MVVTELIMHPAAFAATVARNVTVFVPAGARVLPPVKFVKSMNVDPPGPGEVAAVAPVTVSAKVSPLGSVSRAVKLPSVTLPVFVMTNWNSTVLPIAAPTCSTNPPPFVTFRTVFATPMDGCVMLNVMMGDVSSGRPSTREPARTTSVKHVGFGVSVLQ